MIARYGKLPDAWNMRTLAKSTRVHAVTTARLEARVPRDVKKTLERAAAVAGHPTLTSFVVFSLLATARKAIEEHQQAKLTSEESTTFVQALLAPAAPNRALRDAFNHYRGEVQAGA